MNINDSTNELTQAELTDKEAKHRRVIFALVSGFLIIFLGVLVTQWAAGNNDSGNTSAAGANKGQQLPNIVLTTLEGDPFPMTSVVGKPTVLNFFASWCAPCRAELPAFQEVSQTTEGAVQFIGVNSRETDAGNALDLITQTGVTYTVLLGDDGSLFRDVGGLAMPTTAFVSAEGYIVEVHSGILTKNKLQNKITEHLG